MKTRELLLDFLIVRSQFSDLFQQPNRYSSLDQSCRTAADSGCFHDGRKSGFIRALIERFKNTITILRSQERQLGQYILEDGHGLLRPRTIFILTQYGSSNPVFSSFSLAQPGRTLWFAAAGNGIPMSPNPGARMPVLRTLLALVVCSSMAFAQKPETRPGATVILQLVSMSDEGFASFTLDYPAFAVKGVPATEPQFFNANDLTKLWTSVVNRRDVGTMTTPRITLGSGRCGTVTAGQKAIFTTDYESKDVGGLHVDAPKSEEAFLGLTANLTPVVSADRLRIQLSLKAVHKEVEPNVPLFPVTKIVTPIFEGGSQGQPIPFTQFVQRPVFHESNVETKVSLATGSGVAVYLGKQPMQSRRQSDGVPIVSKIPYLNRLFKNAAIGFEPRHLILIATASVTEIPVVQELVEDYRKAIAEDRFDDAKVFAVKALAADPACFAR